jgi:hypothetical protein
MQFFEKMYPYALKASQRTGIYPSVILAQWANESNYGQSSLARAHNNYAGIKDNSRGKDYDAGSYAGYKSIDSFVEDYARILKLPYYSKVPEGSTAEEQAKLLGASPWAETHYGRSAAGSWLLQLMDDYDLKKYDTKNVTSPHIPRVSVKNDNINIKLPNNTSTRLENIGVVLAGIGLIMIAGAAVAGAANGVLIKDERGEAVEG